MSDSVPRELPSQELRGRHDHRRGLGSWKALKFLVEEEEGLVLEDWSAHGIPKLITHVRVLRAGIGAVPGVEPVPSSSNILVTAKPVSVEVKLVGSAFGHDVDDCSRVAAVFGVEVVRHNTKFLGVFRIRGDSATRTAGNGRVIVADSIQL